MREKFGIELKTFYSLRVRKIDKTKGNHVEFPFRFSKQWGECNRENHNEMCVDIQFDLNSCHG